MYKAIIYPKENASKHFPLGNYDILRSSCGPMEETISIYPFNVISINDIR